jgi:single-stranded DNA-binding protein|nr:MAG TPA: Single strand binding protein [Caudoviricetes sp.]
MNYVFLTGRVAKIEGIKVTKESKNKYFKISLEVIDNNYKSFYSITFWNELAERAENELAVNSIVFVEGKIYRKVYTQNNEKKYYIEVNATNFICFDSKINSHDNNKSKSNRNYEDDDTLITDFDIDSDDFPF